MSAVEVRAVVSGSLRGALPEMKDAAYDLEAAGAKVLSPRSFTAVSESRGFVMLEGDRGTAKEIQERHLAAILQADLLWLVCPGGYAGPSATYEVGYATALAVPVFAAERPLEGVLADSVTVVRSPAEVVARIGEEKGLAPPKIRALARLQHWARAMVLARGFADETLEEVMVLLIEEVGELVETVRDLVEVSPRFYAVFDVAEHLGRKAKEARRQGIAVDVSKAPRHPAGARDELADLAIYLAVMANKLEVALGEAVADKVARDRARSWRRATESSTS